MQVAVEREGCPRLVMNLLSTVPASNTIPYNRKCSNAFLMNFDGNPVSLLLSS